jgi:DNA-binding IclR family transcriptional regulator
MLMTFPYSKRLQPKRMSRSDKAALAALRPLFALHGADPMPLSSRYVATLTGLSQAHASTAMRRLVFLGMIEVVEPGRQGSYRPGTYLLTEEGRDTGL